MARIGADPEELDQLARQFDDTARALANAQGNVGGRVRGTAWSGPDADQFRGWWSRSGSPYLGSVSGYFSGIGRYLREEANQQRWASSGISLNVAWPGRPHGWNDPVPPGGRRGPSGRHRFGDSGSGFHGDPVDTATGALWFAETDMVLASPGGLRLPLGRFHHSWFAADSLSFGLGWVSLLDMRLVQRGDRVAVLTDEGQFLEYLEEAGAFTPSPGITAALSRSDTGWVLSDREGLRHRFDALGRLVGMTQPGDLGFAFEYDDAGIARITGAIGGPVIVERDDNGLVVSLTSSLESAGFEYDDGAHLVAATNTDGVARYEWDDAGRIASQFDRRGRLVASTEFGENGRVQRQLDPEGNEYLFEWDAAVDAATMVDPAGNRWVDRYEDGLLVERIDPLDHRTRPVRDGLRLVGVVTPDGVEHRLPDDGDPQQAGAALESIDADGAEISFGYDSAGLLASISADGETVDLVRRPENPAQVAAVEDRNRNGLVFDHDDAGRLTRIAGDDVQVLLGYRGAAVTEVIVHAADASRRAAIVDGNLVVEIDGVERIVAEGDEEGRLQALIDPLGRRTAFEFDEHDRMLAVIAPDGSRTEYQADLFGRMASRTDGEGRTLQVGRDEAQRLVSISTEDGAAFEFDLDEMGRIVGQTDGAGRPLTIARNETGDTEGLAGAGIAQTLRWQGDRLDAIEDSEATTTLRYDDDGRVAGHERNGVGIDYRYDRDGLVLERTVAGHRIGLGHSDGLETEISSPAGTVDLVIEDDDTMTLELPNGVRSSATWSSSGLQELRTEGPDGLLLHDTFELDAKANVTACQSLGARWDYVYDERDMIVGATRSDGSGDREYAWAHDAVGARLEQRKGDSIQAHELDEYRRPVRVTEDGHARDLRYDEAGYLVQDGAWSFEYDARGALIAAAAGTRRVSYAVDGFGHRVRETVTDGDVVTRDISIVWDLSTELADPVLAIDNLAGRRDLYTYGPMGSPLGVMTDGNVAQARWFVTDALNSVRVVTDQAGRELGRVDYDPFGHIEAEHGTVDTGLLDLRYLGAMRDSATGLHHLRARDYDTSLGRFTTPDPILTPLGMPVVTGYAYAHNRPVSFVDPSGLWPGRAAFNISAPTMPSFGKVWDRVRDVGHHADRFVGSVTTALYENRDLAQFIHGAATVAALTAAVVAIPFTKGLSLGAVPVILKVSGATGALLHTGIAEGARRSGNSGDSIKHLTLAAISLIPFAGMVKAGPFLPHIKNLALPAAAKSFAVISSSIGAAVGALAEWRVGDAFDARLRGAGPKPVSASGGRGW